MKVGIWGSYDYGNYGDDVMAIQFAIALQKLGATPYVYRLDSQLAQQYNIQTTYSLEDLIDQAKFCIIGGGGMLVGESGGHVNAAFDQDFHALYRVSSDYQCPVFPISVGGDGRGADTVLPEGQRTFWQSPFCKLPTVRLTEDLTLLQALGKKATYYPDVLWTVKDFWKIPDAPKSTCQIHVGVNIPNSFAARLLAHQLNAISTIRKDIVFHFIRTYLPNSSANHELIPDVSSPYIQHHTYTDPVLTLNFLASLDLVISYKLHLGLTALALGVPFYNLGGKAKTQSFLRSIGAEFAIWDSRTKNIKLAAFLTQANNIRDARNHFDWSRIAQLKQQSWGHMDRLKELIQAG